MPIYEYRCSACGFEKDALQKMADAPLVDCPNCGQAALVKLVSAAGFQLKGSGWYATDFKGSGNAKAGDKAKPEGAPADAAGAKSEGTEQGASKTKDSGGNKTTEPSGSKTKEPVASKSESSKPASSTTPGAGD